MGATLAVWGDSVEFDGGDLVVRAGGCLLTSMTAMSLLPSDDSAGGGSVLILILVSEVNLSSKRRGFVHAPLQMLYQAGVHPECVSKGCSRQFVPLVGVDFGCSVGSLLNSGAGSMDTAAPVSTSVITGSSNPTTYMPTDIVVVRRKKTMSAITLGG